MGIVCYEACREEETAVVVFLSRITTRLLSWIYYISCSTVVRAGPGVVCGRHRWACVVSDWVSRELQPEAAARPEVDCCNYVLMRVRQASSCVDRRLHNVATPVPGGQGGPSVPPSPVRHLFSSAMAAESRGRLTPFRLQYPTTAGWANKKWNLTVS